MVGITSATCAFVVGATPASSTAHKPAEQFAAGADGRPCSLGTEWPKSVRHASSTSKELVLVHQPVHRQFAHSCDHAHEIFSVSPRVFMMRRTRVGAVLDPFGPLRLGAAARMKPCAMLGCRSASRRVRAPSPRAAIG